MQSEFTISLSSFVLAGHWVSKESTRATNRPPNGRRHILVHFLFCLFLKTFPSQFLQGKENRIKIQLLPNLQQEIKGVSGWDEGKYTKSIIFWFAFLSVISKDQYCRYSCHYSLCLPYYYTIIWMQRMRRHLLKALEYSIWWPQYSLSATLGKLTFHGVPPNNECIRA